jgi:hypothetical protein
VYLDQNELYLPSDIGAQLNHTTPTINFTAIKNAPSPLTLSNLDQLDSIANCTTDNISGCPLYLTSNDNVTANPTWLYGVLPDPVTGAAVGTKSCAIIVTDHGDGIVDAFYMYFYAFNMGQTVLGQVLGDHVGDWEHTMVRFTNGTPSTMWFSQHDVSLQYLPSAVAILLTVQQSGQVFTYDAVSKNGSRPIVYSAIGSHANFAVPGTHSRTIVTLIINDFTSPGPLWDPILSAYYYTYTPTSVKNGTFIPSDPSTPSAWLQYLGSWGDEQYPDSDPRQVNFENLNIEWKYVSGPTGPIDKDLNRTGTCPGNASLCTTLSVLPATSGSGIPISVTRTYSTASISATAASTTGSATAGSASGSASASSTSASNASGVQAWKGNSVLAGLGLLLAWML